MAWDGKEPVTDGINEGLEVRMKRGKEIADLAKIEKKAGFWMVPSVTNPQPTQYKVKLDELFPTCNCRDHLDRRCKCKHIWAVEIYLKRSHADDGTPLLYERITITHQRKTYPQNWPAYNEAQTHEKREFQSLLHDLCKGIPELPVKPDRKGPQGRKTIPLSEAIFCATFKVYSTMSARRFISDLCDAESKGYISRVPHFNSILNYLDNPDLFEVLRSMIIRSSLPLAGVEENFAVDSTGFGTSRFERWFDVKHNGFKSYQKWIKAHICTGVKTNVVTAIEICDGGDPGQLRPLVNQTRKAFTMKEVGADKAYSGEECHSAIDAVGAKPFIMFKENATGGVGGLYGQMFHYFQYRRDDFLNHYHRRSNVESTVMMIKSKFGDSLRSKTEPAQRNETLCKVLCHNICCLISAIYELGIQPEFPSLAA